MGSIVGFTFFTWPKELKDLKDAISFIKIDLSWLPGRGFHASQRSTPSPAFILLLHLEAPRCTLRLLGASCGSYMSKGLICTQP